MNEVIKRAIEGGWGKKNEYRPDLLTYEDVKHWFSGDFSKLLLDPTWWQALGKAEGWEETTHASWNIKGRNIGAWLYHQHRFIDHIAEGKDVDSFFKDLLKC